MSDYINDALLNVGPDKKLKEETKVLVDKWDKTGLLDGINEDFEKSGMAVLLENQAKQLISEANKTSTTANSEEWSGVALPLVRRIFADISAQDFVSVQPMNLPSGLVFYLDFKYGTNVGNRRDTAGGESMFGSTGKNSPFGTSDTNFPSKGLYGAGQFEYTAPTGSHVVAATNNTSVASSSLADLNYDTDFSASNAGVLLTCKMTLANLNSLSGSDDEGVKGWSFDTHTGRSLGTDYEIVPQFTEKTGNVYKFVIKSLTMGTATKFYLASSADINLNYLKQPTATSRGDFEDGNYNSGITEPATNLNIPEVNLELKSSTIVAKTRKLKAVWTPELAQDLNAYHSVDAEAELTSMLSEYISMEIDLEILDMLISDAPTKEYWSARVGYDWNGSSFADGLHSSNALAYTKSAWYETLLQKVQKVSNKIHQLTLRGGANFVVCSPTVATILESIPGYAAATDGNQSNFAAGVKKIGALANRWSVYKNPYMTENTMLVGFRGQNFLETGAVYAPYVPLIMTPLVYDPSNFTPRKGVMTRYAKKMVRPEFYGKIFVHGLETV